MIIVARKLGIVSESWLTRQITLLTPLIELIVVIENEGITEFNGIPVKAIGAENELLYRIQNQIKTKNHKKTLARRLNKILNKSKVSTVVFHYVDYALNFSKVIKHTNKNVYVHCHGYDVTWDLRPHENPTKPRFKSNYTKKVLNLSANVTFIANSADTKSKLGAIGIAEHKIKLKYFGIKTNGFRPIPKEFVISYIGRLVDFKGVDQVIKAFELACDKGLKGKLIIAGDGQLRITVELLKAHSKYKSQIEILGSINAENVQKLMDNTSVFTAHNCKGILSRQEEAFGVSIIEAMSKGLPVITGSVGGVNETVVDGKTGFLISPFDIEAHANAFLKYYHDEHLLIEHGKNAQALVRDKFSEEQEFNFFKNLIK